MLLESPAERKSVNGSLRVPESTGEYGETCWHTSVVAGCWALAKRDQKPPNDTIRREQSMIKLGIIGGETVPNKYFVSGRFFLCEREQERLSNRSSTPA